MNSEKNKRVASQRKLKNSQTAGTVYSNVSSGATVYGEEKFHAIRGHGFAAERANTLYDRYTGHDARILGDDNAKNGADRLVDGVEIQSKYCKTGGKCISECFENGQFRYIGSDGKPMQIEVPSDKYESALQARSVFVAGKSREYLILMKHNRSCVKAILPMNRQEISQKLEL